MCVWAGCGLLAGHWPVDQAADELRERIDSGRERLRRKARTGTTEAEETGELRIEPEDEPPAAG